MYLVSLAICLNRGRRRDYRVSCLTVDPASAVVHRKWAVETRLGGVVSALLATQARIGAHLWASTNRFLLKHFRVSLQASSMQAGPVLDRCALIIRVRFAGQFVSRT